MPAVFHSDVPRPATLIDDEVFRVVALYGRLQFFFVAGDWIEATPDRGARFRMPQQKSLVKTPEGAYLLIMAPVDQDTRPPLDVIEGLLGAVGGKALIYRHLFDNELHSDGRITAYADSVENPAWYDVPNFRSGEMDVLKDLYTAIVDLEQSERARVELALRWIGRATQLRNVDAYLHFWVALETLAMPNTTNIRPAESALAQGYGLSRAEVRQRFGLGRLQGLRARIVHDGFRLQIPGQILKYLAAVFYDLLALRLELPFRRRAEATLCQGSFAVVDWLSEAA